jgi:hypothetical protein
MEHDHGDEQQERFAEAVRRKAEDAEAASRAPHEEHPGDGPVSGAQRTDGSADAQGVRPAGQKGGGASRRWSG